jgi:2-polyprenyl-6-methoxyphenol hydroxylase-like FAD-dependent oxidoreductase
MSSTFHDHFEFHLICQRCVAALWMSRLGISARVIDKRSEHGSWGQADALNARAMEILESFDLAGKVTDRSLPIADTCEWVSGKFLRFHPLC